MKQEHAIDLRKAAIIGCGFVGSATAFTLMQSKLFSELVLIDVDKARAEGEAMDISHGMPFAAPMKIYADIIIITAGANQKPGETRLELVKKNVAIYKNIIPEIANRRCRGILLIVSNPVDILTLAALKLSGFPENRVIGSGTVLDTARLKNMLGKQLGIDNRGVHAFIVGEHGDSEVAVFSSANVSGIPLEQIYKLRGYEEYESHTKRIYEEVKNSAYEIIERKQATYYGIAMAIKRICECIVRDEHSVLPVSSLMHGQYGISDIVLSMPAVVDAGGVEQILPVSLDEEERARLHTSAKALRDVIADIEL